MSKAFDQWIDDAVLYPNNIARTAKVAWNEALDRAVNLLLGKPKVFRSTFERDAVANDLRGMKDVK